MIEKAAANLYRVSSPCSLHWVSWDDEYVVFDDASCSTVLLDPIKAVLLDALSEQALSYSHLIALLEGHLPSSSHDEVAIAVQEALEQLQRLQLVEVVSE